MGAPAAAFDALVEWQLLSTVGLAQAMPYDRRLACNASYFEPADAAVEPASRGRSGSRARGGCRVDDLLLLPNSEDHELSRVEADLVGCLAERCAARQPYTWAGGLLLAVNPGAEVELDLYSPAHITRIADWAALPGSGRIVPHVYAVAAAAHSTMVLERADQSICFLGESGAGKTESCRLTLAYLTQTSIDRKGAADAEGRYHSVEHRLVLAHGVAPPASNRESGARGRDLPLPPLQGHTGLSVQTAGRRWSSYSWRVRIHDVERNA